MNARETIGCHLHGSDRGDRAGVGGEGREGRIGTRLLDVVVGEAGGEVRVARGRGRGLDDLGAVDKVVDVVAEEREVMERVVEPALDLGLVVHERLPLAGRARIAREQVVRLQPHLALERGLDLTLVPARAGEESATELGLDEELGVEELGGRVEGRARNRRVDEVGRSDRVGREQPDGLDRVEAGVSHAGEESVGGV